MKLSIGEYEEDCTDKLMECMTDKSNEECVVEYHECDISKEFTANDVEQCITTGTDYKDCVDHLVATMPNSDDKIEDDVNVDKGDIIAELLTLTTLLDGTMERRTCHDSTGRSWNKIVIEYDIKTKGIS